MTRVTAPVVFVVMREANRRRWDRIAIFLTHPERKSNRLRRKRHLHDAQHKMAPVEGLHGSAPPLPSSPPSPFATASVRTALTSPRSGRAWPLRPLAPAIVILVGLAVAAAIGAFGVANLATASDDHAAARAELLATTLAARLSRLPNAEWLEVMQLAGRKTGAELVVIS